MFKSTCKFLTFLTLGAPCFVLAVLIDLMPDCISYSRIGCLPENVLTWSMSK